MKTMSSPATTVELGDRSYNIYVEKDLLSQLDCLVKSNIPEVTNTVLVTSPNINNIYGRKIAESLEILEPNTIFVPDGEEAKTWEITNKLLKQFLNFNLDRKSIIIAFGGGTIGDIAGFAASIFLRGIKIVQVPTTLLAMVDSSIGGKTGINMEKGKNLIGSFHQPSLVVSDPSLLETLPADQMRSGMGEIAKYGVIHETPLFKEIEQETEKLLMRDINFLVKVIKRCSTIKSWYVERDERDNKGLRAALNYGHTVGHAIEKLAKYTISHGEAVAIGMNIAAKISARLQICDESVVEKQRTLLEKIGLETKSPIILDPITMVKLMKRDKKSDSGVIKMVLPTGIGKPINLRTVSDDLIIKILSE
jgi:3-dehydroquinate synthase